MCAEELAIKQFLEPGMEVVMAGSQAVVPRRLDNHCSAMREPRWEVIW